MVLPESLSKLAFRATTPQHRAADSARRHAHARESHNDQSPAEFDSAGHQRTPAKLTPRHRLLLVVAMLALVGCTDKASTSPLPTAASSPRTSTTPQSDTEAIKRSYIAFIRTLDRADSLPASSRRKQLSIYMTDPQLSQVMNRIQEMKRDNVTSYGSVIPHVQRIEVNGNDATLHDCQDSSNAGNMNTLTRKKIDRGLNKETVTAQLLKGSDGRWRVTKTVSHGKGC
ncbi:hypothetical protein [Actinomadura sp.]|uniref:hypothetical protein n=1 Tax=Actinomadura sp. TaxID=1989 RepID=UPI0037C55BE3